MLSMHQSWLQVLVLSPSTSCLFSSQYIILVAEKEASTKERKKRIRGKRHHKKKNKRYNTCCAQYSFRSYHLSSFTTFVRTVSLSPLSSSSSFPLIPSLFYSFLLLPSLPASGSVSIHSSVTGNHREKKLPMISQVVQFYSETVYSLSGGCSLPSFYMKND